MKIYPDCIKLHKEIYKSCWECLLKDICQACKNNGCSNEEKEYVIADVPHIRI